MRRLEHYSYFLTIKQFLTAEGILPRGKLSSCSWSYAVELVWYRGVDVGSI